MTAFSAGNNKWIWSGVSAGRGLWSRPPMNPRPSWWVAAGISLVGLVGHAPAQVTSVGFLNQLRAEAPGTLLSHPVANGSEPIGRTTSINYVNGWIVVGGEAPGSRSGSDLVMRVYDIANPTAPVRRFPSDFGLTYPNNRWHQGNAGWNAHGSAQRENLLLPQVVRVATFGGPVELGGTNGIPDLGRAGVGYNRSAQAGPWVASFPWYGSPDQDFTIQRVSLNQSGYNTFETLATFDHVGVFGGGDWHPIFFGDLLIYVRSGASARDGVVVYRLQYNNFENAAARSITPLFVGSLSGGFEAYWPVLYSDGDGLFVVGSASDVLMAADVSGAASPAGDGSVTLAAKLTIPNFTNASYPVFQDQFAFVHNRKIDMNRFLSGAPDPIVLTLNEGPPNNVNTSQMSLALGNLWLTGGYPQNFGSSNYQAQGMAVWVHQSAPDTTRPRVSFHIPQSGRTNYPRFAPLSFLVHEHPGRGGPRNGVDFLVRPVLGNGSLGTGVAGMLIQDFSGMLTFTPADGLAADTTYQVDFVANENAGFVDAAGNKIEPYSFRFSTGGGLNAPTPPAVTAVTASTYHPAPGEPFTVTTTATGEGGLEYRFNFTGEWSAWGSTGSASASYPSTGRQRVLVQVRDSNGTVATDSLRLLVGAAPTGPQPTRSSPIVAGDDPAGRRIWTVNPDAHSVSVLDANTGLKVAEYPVGLNPRNIARDANGRYWVTCQGSDEIRILNTNGVLQNIVSLPYGAAPFGIVSSPDGQQMFVTLYGADQVRRFAVTDPNAPAPQRATFPTPRALALSANGQRLLVTRFLSPDLEAEVAEFDATSPTLALVRTFRLESANTIDGGDRAAGVPNYLSGIAISPDGTRAAITSKQDNVQRGTFFGVGNLTHETTVRAVISFLDLTTNAEIRNARRDFDNSDSPSAVTYTARGDTLLVTLQGNNTVVGIDALNLAPLSANSTTGSTVTSPAVISFELGTGLAPQGLIVDPVSQKLFVQDFMGRTVTVRDASPLLQENRTALPLIATSSVVSNEILNPTVLLGKRIFYNASDPRMSADSYISCASCHVDGGSDGRVWDFTGRGEGFRRTTDLRGRAGTGHGNVHWTGNFDEIQDFEHDIRSAFGGTGFLPLTPEQFSAEHPSPASAKTGLNPDLDALAAYLASLTNDHIPRSPERSADGTLTPAAVRGQGVFAEQSCVTCHSGEAFTDSALGLVSTHPLRDVGTGSALSGQRLGQALSGLDTPTLRGLHESRVYLHGGQGATLGEVFRYAGGRLVFANSAERLNPGSVPLSTDSISEGGGGFLRGVLGGTHATIGFGTGDTGLRFTGIDGGPGGPGRLGIRYARQYGSGTSRVRVNGVVQTVDTLRQYPDNSWQISGWRWLYLDINLTAGATNTIDILRDTGDHLNVNAILVSNANHLTLAQPHRRVLALPTGDQNDLLAYLRQLDGRDPNAGPVETPARTFEEFLQQTLTPTQLADPDSLSPYALTLGANMPAVFHFVLGGVAGTPSPSLSLLDPENPTSALRYFVPRNPLATGWRTTVEVSSDLDDWTEVARSEHGSAFTGTGVQWEIPGPTPLTVIGPGVPDSTESSWFYRTVTRPLE